MRFLTYRAESQAEWSDETRDKINRLLTDSLTFSCLALLWKGDSYQLKPSLTAPWQLVSSPRLTFNKQINEWELIYLQCIPLNLGLNLLAEWSAPYQGGGRSGFLYLKERERERERERELETLSFRKLIRILYNTYSASDKMLGLLCIFCHISPFEARARMCVRVNRIE
jgi:hypothetical protein